MRTLGERHRRVATSRPPFRKYFAEASEGEKQTSSMIPLGRLGEPEEYASLASDEALPVGQIISPNGGLVI